MTRLTSHLWKSAAKLASLYKSVIWNTEPDRNRAFKPFIFTKITKKIKYLTYKNFVIISLYSNIKWKIKVWISYLLLLSVTSSSACKRLSSHSILYYISHFQYFVNWNKFCTFYHENYEMFAMFSEVLTLTVMYVTNTYFNFKYITRCWK